MIQRDSKHWSASNIQINHSQNWPLLNIQGYDLCKILVVILANNYIDGYAEHILRKGFFKILSECRLLIIQYLLSGFK